MTQHDDPLTQKIRLALERIRPAMQMDGGDIELVDWSPDEGRVRVALTGACHGCSQATSTMTVGVERVLKQLVPEVKLVETASPDGHDHALHGAA